MAYDNTFDGVNVSISGIHEEDGLAKSNVNEEVSKALSKLAKVTEVTDFSMHVRKYNKDGNRAKYSVHAKLITAETEFYADDSEWEIEKAVRCVFDKLEKEMLKHVEKEKEKE